MALFLENPDGIRVVVHRLVAQDDRIHYLSMGGSREAVEAVWGSVARSHTLTLRGLEGPIHLSRYWGNLRYRRTSLGHVYHGLVISEEVGHTVVIWQTQREAARELSWILGVPVLESWVPWFRAKAQELARNQPLALGAEALYLPTWQQSQLIYALQEALRKGELPLPLEALMEPEAA